MSTNNIFSVLQNNEQSNTLFYNGQSTSSIKTFDEISNEYTNGNPFGKDGLLSNNPNGRFENRNIDKKYLAERIIEYSNKRKIMNYHLIHYNNGIFSMFSIDNKDLDVKTEINTLSGEIDFSKPAKFSFSFKLNKQKAEYKVYYEFVKFKDSAEYNRYGIILTFNKYIDLEIFFNKIDKELYDKTKENIKKEFSKAFAIAKGQSEVLDFIYETAPNFVLQERSDEDLYNDMVVLTNERINIIGTNENISILNILNAIKNYNWFKNEVNKNPKWVRLLFEKFSKKHIADLITTFIKIGLSAWNEVELQNALSYSLESSDDDFDKDHFIDSRIVYWCGYIDKEKKYEVGFSIHQYDKTLSAVNIAPHTLGYVETYFPLQITNGNTTFFIPAFVAEYFTNEQLKEDKMIILDNISTMLLPETTLAKVKPFLGVKIPKIKNATFNEIISGYKTGKITRIFSKYLSLEEEAILRFYTTNAGYKNFNKALRGEIQMTQEFKAQAELMNKALDKLPKYQSNEMLYRIENLTESEINRIYKTGKTVENKHFTSSTYDYNALRDAVLNRQFTVIIRIKSKNGRLIEELSTLKKEKEVLFKSNSKFTVEKIGNTQDPNDWMRLVKEIILIEK